MNYACNMLDALNKLTVLTDLINQDFIIWRVKDQPIMPEVLSSKLICKGETFS